MKWFIILLSFCCFSVSSAETNKEDELSHFDTPFLIGDWYLMNPNPEDSAENFRAIKLTLGSNYTFSIDIQKKDYSIDHWEGLYNANEDTIVLGLNTDEPQIYTYQNNHNTLDLNGVTFTKGLSNALAGIWSSSHVAGDGMLANNINQMDLILQPDFVFMFRVANESGEESVKQGVFYTEGEHLVLLYENGEHGTRYKLNQNELTIEDSSGEMYAVLNRVTP
ncbi:WD40 repeat protein [Vibrio harveyi]|nr:WD40 repeat protein [Vibrio harveyi]